MKFYALTDDDGRLTLPPDTSANPGWVEVEAEDGIEGKMLLQASEYVVKDGVLTWEPTEEQLAEAERQKAYDDYYYGSVEIAMNTDDSVCELFESSASNASVIAEQDAAICQLYEMLIGGSDGESDS